MLFVPLLVLLGLLMAVAVTHCVCAAWQHEPYPSAMDY
jgi:hypothetical protein